MVGFGVQCPDHGDCDHVADGEDVECLLIDLVEHYRAEECLLHISISRRKNGRGAYEPAIPNTPSNNSPRVAFGSYLEWENLGGVKPGDCEPGGTEYECEDEDHGCCGGSVL